MATQPTTTPDGRGWRPVGVVLTHTAFAVAIGLIAIGALVGYDPAELTRALTDALIEWGTTAGADSGRVLTASDVEPFVSLNVALLPVASGIFGVTMAAIDLYLGYKSVMLSERFRRPAESLSSIALPISVPAALVVAAALALVPGALGYAAGVLAGALAAAVAMVGLAVVHALTRGLNWRGPLLAALYALLVVLSGLPLILLTLLGMAESAFHIRARRFKPSGPAQT